MRKPKNIVKYRIIFFATIIIAIVARVIGIGNSSLSITELQYLNDAQTLLKDQLQQFSYATSNSSPLYSLLLHGWIELVGNSDIALRSLSALISFLGIFPIFGIARMLFNKRIAYSTILFYALLPLSISLAQSISPLTLFIQFSLMSTWALTMISRRSNPEYRIFYFLTVIGAIYTHPAFWFLFLFHQIVALTAFFHHEARHLSFKQWSLIQALLLIGVALTLPEKLPSVALPFNRGWSTPFIGVIHFLFSFSESIILSLVLITMLYQLFFNSRRYQIVYPNFPPKIVQVVTWIAAVGIPPFLFNFEQGMFGRANGAVAMIPPLLLLVSGAIETFEKKRVRQTIIGIISILSVFSLYRRYNEPTTIDWSSLIESLTEKQMESGFVIDESLYPLFMHYSSFDSKFSSCSITVTDSLNPKDVFRSISSVVDTSMIVHVLLAIDDSLFLQEVEQRVLNDFSKIDDSIYTVRGSYNREISDMVSVTLQRKE